MDAVQRKNPSKQRSKNTGCQFFMTIKVLRKVRDFVNIMIQVRDTARQSWHLNAFFQVVNKGIRCRDITCRNFKKIVESHTFWAFSNFLFANQENPLFLAPNQFQHPILRQVVASNDGMYGQMDRWTDGGELTYILTGSQLWGGGVISGLRIFLAK